MSLRRMMPWLIALLIATVAGMVLAARAGLRSEVRICAAIFALAIIATALSTNWSYWQPTDAAGSARPLDAARRNARLALLAYAWGALAMLAQYTTPLTGLWWQHGWQYALAFALLAAGALAYVHLAGSPPLQQRLERVASPLAGAQAVISAGGLAYLVGSGKLAMARADWAADIVFLFAALMIMVVSAAALRTHVLLRRSSPPAGGLGAASE